jgi:hypothetical protein
VENVWRVLQISTWAGLVGVSCISKDVKYPMDIDPLSEDTDIVARVSSFDIRMRIDVHRVFYVL